METWLPSLITNTPEEGYNLAVTLARKAVGMIQPDPEVKKRLRPIYSENADSLTFASQVVAIHFQTVAAANNYWK
ncbi:MAG: peroxidase [Clostridium sp.]|nr:peroxidase [Clostridium sp.]